MYSKTTQHVISSLGSLIKLARKERGMSLTELAERLNVKEDLVQDIENGVVTIPIGIVIEAAIIVGLPLFGGDREHVSNLSTMLAYMNKVLPKQIRKDIIVNDDF